MENSVYSLVVVVWNGNLEDGERDWKIKKFFHIFISSLQKKCIMELDLKK